MDVLSTGIPTLDDALGGGLLEDSNLLILYDTYSYGWTLAFEIMRKRIEMGDFGVIVDSVLPLSSLRMELGVINFDLYREGEAGNLGVIDLFSSFYRVSYPEEFVYTDTTIDALTSFPKYIYLYRRLLEERIDGRRPVGVSATIDGLAFLLGEDNLIKMFQRLVVSKELARMKEKRKRPINIWLLNKGRASERLVSWIALYSHYVVDFIPCDNSTYEKMVIRKSPLSGFGLTEGSYTFRLVNGRVEVS